MKRGGNGKLAPTAFSAAEVVSIFCTEVGMPGRAVEALRKSFLSVKLYIRQNRNRRKKVILREQGTLVLNEKRVRRAAAGG